MKVLGASSAEVQITWQVDTNDGTMWLVVQQATIKNAQEIRIETGNRRDFFRLMRMILHEIEREGA